MQVFSNMDDIAQIYDLPLIYKEKNYRPPNEYAN